MYQVLLFIYVVVAIALIGLTLVQQGKGANAGASFGWWRIRYNVWLCLQVTLTRTSAI